LLQLYDLEKNKIKGLKLYKDYCIESVLATGDRTLSFLYPSRLSKDIKEECYIRTKKDEFVVKEISTNGEWNSIKARLNVDELEGKPWEHFDTTEQTIEQCLNLALAGTGWTVQVNNVTKKRTIRKTNCSSWDIIQQAKKTYLVEMQFDTINKKINIAEKLGSDKGAYFMDSLNLRDLDIQSNSYDFYTRIVAIGKDDLKVTVENFQYSTKKKTLIWKDERYTDLSSLTEDATLKLKEISKPYRSYKADVIDLANTSNKYSILAYSLGDTITLISKYKGIKEKQRIVKMTEYPEEPNRNSCEIANSLLSFADVQKEYQDTTETVNNITEDNGTISQDAIKVAVKNLTVDKLDVGSLNAVEIRVGNLEATKANITELKAVNADIANLHANKAEIGDLTVAVGRVDILESNVGDIKTLVNGNLTSNNIQSLNLTSDKVTVANGFIKNAMIDSLDVNKISAGDISVNKFRIKSDSGNLLISDNTIQIKDSVRTRVQIGKDASNDYNMYVWDSTGKLMFDATGLKANGIKDKIIRDDMVSDTANISGNKLNISSVVTSINNGTTTLNSSKILLDGTAQTLNVAFNTLSTKVDSAPPSITTDNSVTKLDGAIDGMLKLNSIKGRTLQNLYKATSVVGGSLADGYYYIKNTTSNLITGKTVTFINLNDKIINYQVRENDVVVANYTLNPNSKIIKTLKTTEVLYAITYSVSNGWNDTNKTTMIGMVLEGDWTNKEISQYFEGIRSVGENGENLEVVSCGKNLFDGKKAESFNPTLIKFNENILTLDTIWGAKYNNFLRLKHNTSYKVSGIIKIVKKATGTILDKSTRMYLGKKNVNNSYTYFPLYNIANASDLNVGDTIPFNQTIITPHDIQLYDSILFYSLHGTPAGIVQVIDLQIEEGTTATPYEQYKEHRQSITLTEPLRGLPNGVRDTIDFESGVVVRNVGSVILNGSGNISSISAMEKTIKFAIENVVTNIKYANVYNLICDKFTSGINIITIDTEGIRTASTSPAFYISIEKSKLTTPDIAGFKAWLQANPITVYYQLEIPIEEPIKVEQYMKQFAEGYFMMDGSLIIPEVDFDYSTSLASATSMMKEVTEANTTYLNVQQGKIDTLISNTTIVKDGQTIQLKDSYNSTVATVDSLNSTIGKHTSTIDALGGQITSVDTKANTIQRDLDGVKTSVSAATTTANSALSKATEAKQSVDGFAQRVSNVETNYATTNAMNSAISQSASGVKTEVSNTFISKADATLTYATKSSLTLAENSIVAKFTSSGGYNLLKNSAFANTDTANWGMYKFSKYTGNPSYFTPKPGSIALGLIASTYGYFYQSLDNQLARNTVYTFSAKTWWEQKISGVSMRIEYFNGSAYVGETVVNLINSGERKSYTFTTKNIDFTKTEFRIYSSNATSASDNIVTVIDKLCLCEGDVAVWSPHPSELIDGSTRIDGSGVEISNGALKVTNTNSQVVIDGKYNMHKIVSSGVINITMEAGQYQKTATVTHNLGYIPANLCFIQSDNGFVWNFPFMTYINFSAVNGLTINELGRAWANSTLLEFVFIRPQDLTPAKTYKVRYYIYKEVAI